MPTNSQAQFFTVSSVALKAGLAIHNEHMGEAFTGLVNMADDALIFTADKGRIPVNRALLSVFSPNLRKLFEDVPCCVSPTIFLPDCNSSSIYHLLSIISTGVTNNDKIVPKDVISAAKLVSIDLKNIVRGTLGTSKNQMRSNKVNGEVLLEETFIEQPLAQNNNKRKSHMPDPDAEKNQNNKKLRLKFNFPSKKDVVQQVETFPSSQQSSPRQFSPRKQSQQVESSQHLVLPPSQPFNSNSQQFGTSQQFPSQQSEPPLHFGGSHQYPSQSPYVTPQSTNMHYQPTNPLYLSQNQFGSAQKTGTPQQFPALQQYPPQNNLGTPQHYPSQIQLGSSQQVINPPQHPSQNQFGPSQQFGLQQYSSQQHLVPQIASQQLLNQTLPNSPQIPPPSVFPLDAQNQLPHLQSQTPSAVPPRKVNEPISDLTKQTVQSPQSIPPPAFAEVIDATPSKSVNPINISTNKNIIGKEKRKRTAVSTKSAEPELIDIEDTETETNIKQAEPTKIIEAPIDVTKECQICHEKETKLSLLWRHYYVKHFYKELKSKFEGKIINNSCPTCGAKFPAIQAVLLHLGRNHNEINHLLKVQNFKQIPKEKEELVSNEQKTDSVPETIALPQTTPLTTIKKEPINCQICSEGNFISISALWSHYCLGHYYSDLKSKFGHLLKDNMCVICDKTFDRPMKSILHLGTSHRKLNQILKENGLTELLTPKEYAQKSKESSLNSTTASQVSSTPSTLQASSTPTLSTPQSSSAPSLPQSEDPNVEVVKSEPISCLMCKQNHFRNYDDLWRHYSSSHFYQELKAQFGQYLKGKTCTSCNLKFGARTEAAEHIGMKHQQVNVLLKSKGLDELPLPTIHQFPSSSTSYYLVDLEDDKISLQTREPKQNSLVDLETNKIISQPETVTGVSNEAFTEEQIELLMEEFKEDEELPAERKNALALALELTEDEVENWFKNRRENRTNDRAPTQLIDTLTEEQESILREEFSEDPNLSAERLNTLALALELTENQVEKWFEKNRNVNLINQTSVGPMEVEEPVEPIPPAKEEFLKLEFESNPEFSGERIVELALALGLEENQVKKWFNGKIYMK